MKREVPPDPATPSPEEGAKPQYHLPVEVEGDMGDVLNEFKLLQRAGVGFGQAFSMRLYLALKTLLHRNLGAREGEKIVRVRSWGKVLGLSADYLVAECVMEGRQPLPAVREGLPASVVPPDAVGDSFADFVTSSNHFVYYVTNAPSEEWVRLPDAQPRQIAAALNIKRAFTGDLSAPVSSKAPFPGKEAEYLRAQIARISHATRIAPRGHLVDVTDYEGGGDLTVGQSEEGTFFGLTIDEMCDLRNKAWVHASNDLLPQGRASYYNYGWVQPDDKPDVKDPRLEKNRPALQVSIPSPRPSLSPPSALVSLCVFAYVFFLSSLSLLRPPPPTILYRRPYQHSLPHAHKHTPLAPPPLTPPSPPEHPPRQGPFPRRPRLVSPYMRRSCPRVRLRRGAQQPLARRLHRLSGLHLHQLLRRQRDELKRHHVRACHDVAHRRRC